MGRSRTILVSNIVILASLSDDSGYGRYNGRETAPPTPFPKVMEEACQIVEKIVSEELSKRARYPLEWAGSSGPDKLPWRANVAASNCYEGTRESVGFHSDQLTYLGPYPTIASISLGEHLVEPLLVSCSRPRHQAPQEFFDCAR